MHQYSHSGEVGRLKTWRNPSSDATGAVFVIGNWRSTTGISSRFCSAELLSTSSLEGFFGMMVFSSPFRQSQ